jgi:transmembrane sensor
MNSDKIEEAAARWLARRESDSLTDAEQAAFDAWLEQRTEHRIAYIRLEAAWNHSERMRALGAGVTPGVIPPRGTWGDQNFFSGGSRETQPPPPTPASEPVQMAELSAADNLRAADSARIARRGTALRHLAVAASLLLVIAGGSLYVYNSGIFSGDRYSTSVGGLDTERLADGSNVTLNTDSRIRVALADKERRIALDKGEAFFEVAHDPNRPFIVDVGNKRVIAVGTQFSVRVISAEAGADDIRVAVTEGKVRFEDIIIPAGSVAQTAKSQVLVRETAAPEVEQLLSWRKGYVVFRDTPLADAVAEFNRYNTRKIVIENPGIAAIRIGGNFRSNNTDAFLWLLQSGFPVTADVSDDKVILRSRGT